MRRLRALVVILIVFLVAFLAFTYSGIYNVAAIPRHSGAIDWMASRVSDHSVEVRAKRIQAPALDRPALLTTGFHHYREMCVDCHGAPGVEPEEFSKGLNPRPPNLMHEARSMTPQEIFWIVKNGIKMTGMPGFGNTHTDEEIWAMTALVKQLPDMTPAEFEDLGRTGSAPDEAPGETQSDPSREGSEVHE